MEGGGGDEEEEEEGRFVGLRNAMCLVCACGPGWSPIVHVRTVYGHCASIIPCDWSSGYGRVNWLASSTSIVGNFPLLWFAAAGSSHLSEAGGGRAVRRAVRVCRYSF